MLPQKAKGGGSSKLSKEGTESSAPQPKTKKLALLRAQMDCGSRCSTKDRRGDCQKKTN